MNRIAGVISLAGRPVQNAEIAAMAAALDGRQARGPERWGDDSVAMVQWGGWSLQQKGPFTLVADARLDNREELADRLDFARLTDDTTDAALLLAAFETWRDVCVEHLRGDFAFAVWDSRERALFCARDHFGVKPFFYGHWGDRFAFASEVGPLLALPGFPNTVNEERIADFLVQELEGCDEVRTFYQQVVRLPPAHVVWVKGAPTLRRYFSLEPQPELRLRDDREYADALREVFTRAVATRLRGGAAVGSMLSGGLDSSSIVAVARDLRKREGGPPLRTFSAVIDDANDIESRCSRAVAAQGGLDATFVRPDDLEAHLDNLLAVARHSHDPFDLTIAHVPLTMYSAARKAGCTAVLDGTPGDLLVRLGPGYVSYLLRQGEWFSAIHEVLGRRSFMGARAGNPALALVRHARVAITPRWFARWRVQRANREGNPLFAMLAPEFAGATRVHERLADMYTTALPPPADTFAARQARTFRQPWVTAAVERYGRVAAALRIEARHPFMDLRLAQFCLSLPWRQLANRGIHKVALRRAMAPLLPPQVNWRRPSSHLGPRFTQAWLAFFAPWLARLSDANEGALDRYVSHATIAHAQALLQGGRADSESVWQLWLAVCLGIWLTRQQPRVIKGPSPVDVPPVHLYNGTWRDITR